MRFLVDGVMQTSPDLPTTVDFGNNLVNYIEVNPDDLPLAQKQGGSASRPEGEAEGVSRSSSQSKDQPRQPRGRPVDPPTSYQNAIPQYLLDFDQPEESPAYRNAVAAIEKLPTPPSLPGFLGKPILNAATLMKDDNSVLNMPNHTVLNHLATSSIKNNVLAVSATTRYHNKVSRRLCFLYLDLRACGVCFANHVGFPCSTLRPSCTSRPRRTKDEAGRLGSGGTRIPGRIGDVKLWPPLSSLSLSSLVAYHSNPGLLASPRRMA